jgi:hypothetical protein
MLSEQATDNPRINASVLRARFSLDEAVAIFWRIAGHFRPSAAHSTTVPAPRPVDNSKQMSGPEVWIDVDDPPLCGRIDLVDNRQLVEFKTGEEDERHSEQLRFYALLWWLRTGSLPEQITLSYVHLEKLLKVPVPTLDEVRKLREDYHSLTAEANWAIDQKKPEARTSEALCRYCSVRQLCVDYWNATNTLPLRNLSTDAETVITDLQLTEFPDKWSGSGTLSGIATATTVGEVSVFIGAHKCPTSDSPRPESAVILSAKAQREGDKWRVTATPSSEVFWTIPT